MKCPTHCFKKIEKGPIFWEILGLSNPCIFVNYIIYTKYSFSKDSIQNDSLPVYKNSQHTTITRWR